jgi:hypothetical protein
VAVCDDANDCPPGLYLSAVWRQASERVDGRPQPTRHSFTRYPDTATLFAGEK